MSACLSLSALALLLSAPGADAALPRIADDRLVIEMVAQHPDIVTPTGLTVDEQGRLWVIENNTHQRTNAYKGHPSDRIRVFSDPAADGTFRKITTFAEGFKNAMSIALGREGVVYLATRSDIWSLRDSKGTGVADERKVIVKLDSPGDYPHNGLAGFAFDAMGDLYFSLGENLGAPYKLIGSDGSTESGGGEGGSIYRCRPDGSKLVRVATGFWNTFHLTFDAFGRLFAVDNDPDARGPCRLLHIVPGGDYGYRFRNGRRGLHPFTAWNGELPGTLPMVAGTAEAPSGILAYESNGLPEEYRGRLLTTSWGDHVVEQFTLIPRGASFGAKSSVLVRGDENFRPVAIATGPDGSIYLSDWVDKSYPVHGKGRIWRIRMKERPKDDGLRPTKVAKLGIDKLIPLLSDPRREIRLAAGEAVVRIPPPPHERSLLDLARAICHGPIRARLPYFWSAVQSKPHLARALLETMRQDSAPELRADAVQLLGRTMPADPRDEGPILALAAKDPSPYVRMHAILQLRTKESLQKVLPVLADPDPFLAAAALDALGRAGNTALLTDALGTKDARLRLGILLALRRGGTVEGRKLLPRFLADADPGVRRAAVQWVGEERFQEYAEAIAVAAAKEPVTRDLFEALLAAQTMLAATPRVGTPESSGEEFIARIVKDHKQPAVFRTLGLRMLRPDHPVLTRNVLKDLLKSPERGLREEAARTLAMRSDGGSQEELRLLAADTNAATELRAFAILGLAHSAPTSAPTRQLLLSLLGDIPLQRDALRSLRGVALDAAERRSLFTWWDTLPEKTGISAEGRRELAEQVLLILGPKEEEERRKQLTELVGSPPANEEGWRLVLPGRGNAAAGERVFFHLRGPRCAVCHRVDGRGGQVGPELSAIARSNDRAKLIESILTPSKEIAPAFTTWIITLRDGKTHTGVILSENFDSTLTLADADGKRIVLKRLDIEEKQASPKSLMPDDLHRLMTRQEFRDLLAYLSSTGVSK